jgi:hypothetical protein
VCVLCHLMTHHFFVTTATGCCRCFNL